MTAQPPAHILIVDDDPDIRDILRDCLEFAGLQVTEAANSNDMLRLLANGGFDLVTLDLNLGGENSLPLTGRIKTEFHVPIIMITGQGDTIDRVVGLELGADDYISKPFHPREVVARVRAVLRRTEKQVPGSGVAAEITPSTRTPPERFAFDGWTLDIGKRELMAPDALARELTTAEFNLLEALARRPHRVLSRDTIMDLLKGHDWSPFDRSIDALVSRLRRKIECNPQTPSMVKTVRGVGYIFACEVQSL